MFDLAKKIAIITGSSRGIGASIAETLAQQGATVIINYRNNKIAANEVLARVEASGGTGTIIQADVSDNDSAQTMIKSIIDTYGQIDILVNNAGVTRDAIILKMKEDDWQTVMQNNLASAYYCSKAVIRPMLKKRQGRIINIASVIGLIGQAGQTNYAASKAGLIGFTKSLAREVGSRNITVNAVAPGFIPTSMTENLPEKILTDVVKNTPLGRLGSVEDIAYAVAFLASNEASFITGQVLTVDGGLVMQ